MTIATPVRFAHDGRSFVCTLDRPRPAPEASRPARGAGAVWIVKVDGLDYGAAFLASVADTEERVREKAIRWWDQRADQPRRR
jgi:hypothetical protein